MYKIKRILHFLFLLLLLLCCLFVRDIGDNRLLHRPLIYFNHDFFIQDEVDGWYYLEENFPYENIWLPDQKLLTGFWRSFQLSSSLPLQDDREYLWIKTLIPKSTKSNDALFFDSTNQAIRIWVDNTLIYDYGEMHTGVYTYGRSWHIVPLPKDSSGRTLTLELHAADQKQLGAFDRFFIRGQELSYFLLFLYDIPFYLAIAVSLTLIYFVLIYVRNKTTSIHIFRAFLLFKSIFILWMIAASNTILLIYNNPELWWNLHMSCVYLIIPAVYNLFYQILEEHRRRIPYLLIWVHLAVFGVMLLADLFVMRGALAMGHHLLVPLIIIGGVPIAYQLVQSARYGNAYSKAVLFPATICYLLFFIDTASMLYRFWPRTIYLSAFTAPLYVHFIYHMLNIQTHALIQNLLQVNQLKSDLRSAHKQVQIDPLTGAFNRWKFEEAYASFLGISKRTNRYFSLLMFDIDHFKKVNDTHGHDVGDLVLKNFCNTVRSLLDRRHILIRWGGEEFILLALHQTPDEVLDLAERIRHTVESSQVNPFAPLTCSVGLTSWNDTVTAPTDLIKKADNALYRAKSNGRNRIEVEI